MRTTVTCLLFVLTLFAASAAAASFEGYIVDSNCAAKQGAKAASDGHANCAAKCIKGGAKAVLVNSEGKVYQIANQDKVVDHAGHKVTIDGKLSGETITVSNVKM